MEWFVCIFDETERETSCIALQGLQCIKGRREEKRRREGERESERGRGSVLLPQAQTVFKPAHRSLVGHRYTLEREQEREIERKREREREGERE